MLRKSLFITLLLGSAVGFPVRAIAEIYMWNSTTGNWSEGSNWSTGDAPSGAELTDILGFGGTGDIPYTSTNDSEAVPFLFNQLSLQNGSPATEILTGNAISLAGPDAQIVQNGTGSMDINMPVVVLDPLSLTGGAPGVVTLNGVLSGGSGITKSGMSTFRLGTAGNTIPSDNTFYGGVTINDGILRFNNNADSGPSALRSNRVTFGSITSELRIGASSNASPQPELRTGEWTGDTGAITAQNTSVAANGLDVTLHLQADAKFSGALIMSPKGTSTGAGKLTVRGHGTQTLGGTLSINNDLVVGHGAGLTLADNASIGLASKGGVEFDGGTLTLDNTSINNNNRLRDAGASSTSLDTVGGGTFRLIGNALGTTETVGRLQLGSTSNERAGSLNIDVVHNAGSIAATVLNIASYSRDSTTGPRDTLNFSAHDASGNVLPLGQAGNNPRVSLGGVVNLQHDLLSRSDVGPSATSVGWATVNGSDFATNGGGGIAAVTTTPFPAASAPAENVLLDGNGTIDATTGFNLNSLKIAPTASGQSLSITGSGSLVTNGILLAGTTDYTVSNSGAGAGGIAGSGGVRYFHVQSAVLNVNVPVDPSGNGTVKAGQGTLSLGSSANASSTGSVTINDGTVRASAGTLPGGRVELRGGVLELAGGLTFNRALGTAAGSLNWSGVSGQDRGGGGFAAFGAPATVDLNNVGASDISWEQPSFLQSGYALVFGSTRADSRISFLDNLSLTQAGLGNDKNYNAREIQVLDNSASGTDFARMSGVISGSVRSDLLKTGPGTLELTAANTMAGGIIVAQGSLLTNNNSGLGAADGAYVLLGARGGADNAALLASNTSGVVTLARDIRVQSGGTGQAVLGNTVAPDAVTAGSATYSGNITVGLTGDSAAKTVRLTSAPNSSVAVTGAISPTPGYTGTIDIMKDGAGTVSLAGANTYTGATTVSAGTLLVSNAFGSATGAGSVLVNNGAILGGTGTISGPVAVASGGIVSPGIAPGSAGTLALGGYTQNAGGTLKIDLAGTTAGSFDTLVVGGAATLAGTLNVQITSGFQPTAGDKFQVLNYGSHSGTFTTIQGLDLGGGLHLNPVYNATNLELDVMAAMGSFVQGRHLFYNNSKFDGSNAAITAADDAAIAPDKSALLPGGTATFANYTSYTKGINGIAIDISNLPGTPTAADFSFKVGNDNTPNDWTPVSAQPTIAVRHAAGANGSDRIELVFPDGALVKEWFQVTVNPTAATGLASPDVFYFGNAVGEAGNLATNAQVTAGDEIEARNDPHNILTPAPITNRHDYNRDMLVNAQDQIIARNNGTNLLNRLALITVPASLAAAPVPEPSALVLACLGLVSLIVWGRRGQRTRRAH